MSIVVLFVTLFYFNVVVSTDEAFAAAEDIFLQSAKRDAFEALNAKRRLECPEAPKLFVKDFTLFSWELTDRGAAISIQFRSTLRDAVTVVLRGKDPDKPADASSTFEILESSPEACQVRVPLMGAPHALDASSRLVKASVEWAQAHINDIRQQKCPHNGGVSLSFLGSAKGRIIAGVEISLQVKVRMPDGFNLPGDQQLSSADHELLVRWEAGQSTIQARRLRRGAASKGWSSSASATETGRSANGGSGPYRRRIPPTSQQKAASAQLQGAPFGMDPSLLLSVSACSLLLRSTVMRTLQPGIVTGGRAATRQLGDTKTNHSDARSLAEIPDVRRLQSEPLVMAPSYDERAQYPECYRDSDIRNQGECSSAWAIAAASAVSDRLCRSSLRVSKKLGEPPRQEVAVQRVLSCNVGGLGCMGGSLYAAYEAMMEDSGIFSEESYPYSVRCWSEFPHTVAELSLHDEAQCDQAQLNSPRELWPCKCQARLQQMPKCQRVAKQIGRVLSYYRLPSVFDVNPHTNAKYQGVQVVDWMKKELLARGPYAVGFELFDDFFYSDFSIGSVYACMQTTEQKAAASVGGHVATLFGWGEASSTPYWLLRNSFGRSWGDRGFFRLQRWSEINGLQQSSCLIEQWTAVPELAIEVLQCNDKPTVGLHVTSDLFRCRGTRAGDSCAVDCESGYELQPPEGLRCSEDGRWTPAWCKQLPCMMAPPVPHRLIPVPEDDCVGIDGGSTCPIRCVAGYEATGDAQCVGGRWNIVPTCEPLFCEQVPRIHNAGPLDGCAGRPSGGICEVQCKAGFEKTGNIDCRLGQWTSAECKPVSCILGPSVDHCIGCEQGSGAPSGTMLNIECDSGYTKTGNPRCERGHWSRVSCVPNMCKAIPIIANAEDLSHCRNKEDGERCWFRCKQGYFANGALACYLGQWSSPVCEATSIKRPCWETPMVKNSVDLWNCHGTASGEACPMSCRTGYRVVGQLLCVNGAWAHPRCEPIACETVPVTDHSHGMSACTGAAGGASCLLTCSASYVATRAFVTCRNGIWNSAPRCAPVHCAAIPIVSNAIGDLTSCRNASAGSKCSYRCKEGYEAQGDLKCIDGNWNGPLCEAAPCRSAPQVNHAQSLLSCAGLPSGSVCEVRCLRGHVKRADLVCLLGQWHAEVSACEPQQCFQIPLVSNAAEMKSCQGMPSGGWCELRCLPGFYRSGEGLMCLNGAWNFHEVSCEPLPCNDVPVPIAHAHALSQELQKCAGTNSGQYCPLVCDEGFHKSGELICHLGQWLTASVHCLPARATELQVAVKLWKSGTGNETLSNHGMPLLSAMRQRPCMVAPRIPNSEVLDSCSNQKSGEICELSCKLGYRKTSDLRCIDGTWIPQDTQCQALRCTIADLFLDRAKIPRGPECDDMASGLACEFHCVDGFACRTGSALIPSHNFLKRPEDTCVAACEHGSWNVSEIQCQLRSCEFRPSILHADQSSLDMCRGTPSGGKCTFKCKSGWHPSNDIACVRGRWGVAACIVDPCSAFKGLNTSKSDVTGCSPSSFTSGGVPNLLCQRGSWVGEAQSVGSCARCDSPPKIKNAMTNLSECAEYASGAACPLHCRAGYKATRSVIFCEDGLWQTAACEPSACESVPPIPHSNPSSLESCTGMASGSSCPLQCFAGFIKTGDLLCHLGKFRRQSCNREGYLGAQTIDLLEDSVRGYIESNGQLLPSPGTWQMKHTQPLGVHNVTLPTWSMQSVMPRNSLSVFLELPSIYVGPGGGSLSFRWRVDSETGKDLLHLKVDGVETQADGFPHSGPSEETAWHQTRIPLTSGLHVLTWTYTKDKSVDVGSDAAMIADVVLGNALVLGTYGVRPEQLQIGEDGTESHWHEVIDKSPHDTWEPILQAGGGGETYDLSSSSRLDMTLPTLEIVDYYGVVSFHYRTSSERGFDMLRFLVDDVEQRMWTFPRSGHDRRWHLVQFRVAKGFHSLTWRFQRDLALRGDEIAQVSNIRIRNMRVSPITLSETLEITHASGNLAAREADAAVAIATLFGRPSKSIVVRFQNRDASPVQIATLYNVYIVEVRASCSASSECRNVSSTMAHIRAFPNLIAQPIRTALNQQLIRIERIDISRMVMGSVLPSGAMKLYRTGHRPFRIQHHSRIASPWFSSLQTSLIFFAACLAVVSLVACGAAWQCPPSARDIIRRMCSRRIGVVAEEAEAALAMHTQCLYSSDSD